MSTTPLSTIPSYIQTRERALQDRAMESKALAKDLEWRPLFETFKDLKKI